jgi:lipoate-protein ligase B
VPYREADDLQRAIHGRSRDDYLLLLEHPAVYTLGRGADLAHVLVPPASVGAELVKCDRGGDVTFHGPGQLVGYPIITLPEWREGRADVVAYVRALEAVLVATLADLSVRAAPDPAYTGVWAGEEKVAAIGVKVARGRTRHGFALNVSPDLEMFDHIVPCGIADRGVTSLAALLGTAPISRKWSTPWSPGSPRASATTPSSVRTSRGGAPSPRSIASAPVATTISPSDSSVAWPTPASRCPSPTRRSASRAG